MHKQMVDLSLYMTKYDFEIFNFHLSYNTVKIRVLEINIFDSSFWAYLRLLKLSPETHLIFSYKLQLSQITRLFQFFFCLVAPHLSHIWIFLKKEVTPL